MNADQIRKCAEEIVNEEIFCMGYIDQKPERLAIVEAHVASAVETISRHIAEAKEAEDDVRWLQGLVAGAVKAGLPGCHAETHRMIRILKRLENEVRK